MTITTRRLWPFAAALLAASLLGVARSAPAPREIVWSVKRPLRWDDFVGRVPKSAPAKNVAMTAASLRFGYGYSLEWSRNECAYRITSVTIDALFDPRASWVRPGSRTAVVLAHEQGHFDIAEIHKLMFEAASRPFVDKRAACRGRDKKSISKYVEHDIDATLGKLYQRIWTNQVRVQNAYDGETAHGLNASAQKAWLRKIAAGLKGRGWGELGPAGAGGRR